MEMGPSPVEVGVGDIAPLVKLHATRRAGKRRSREDRRNQPEVIEIPLSKPMLTYMPLGVTHLAGILLHLGFIFPAVALPGSIFLYNTAMIEINVPGRGILQLEHLVCDVNGTLAVDGLLQDGLLRQLRTIRDRLELHLLTADTHGRQHLIDRRLALEAVRIPPGDEAQQKAEYIRRLGAESVVAVGQGANDAGMLKEAALGICVFSPEGVAIETLLSADLLVPDIYRALELLERPLRIVATLRR